MATQQPNNQQNRDRGRNRGGNRPERTPSEFEHKVLEIRRVSKKNKGGNRISFTALVVVGDQKGKVGVGLGKAPDVRAAVEKGTRLAQRDIVKLPIVKGTIPHRIEHKFGSARILLKPAPAGTGVIAGGSVRAVVEAAGVSNIVGKILGNNNKMTNVYATFNALREIENLQKKRQARIAASKSK